MQYQKNYAYYTLGLTRDQYAILRTVGHISSHISINCYNVHIRKYLSINKCFTMYKALSPVEIVMTRSAATGVWLGKLATLFQRLDPPMILRMFLDTNVSVLAKLTCTALVCRTQRISLDPKFRTTSIHKNYRSSHLAATNWA